MASAIPVPLLLILLAAVLCLLQKLLLPELWPEISLTKLFLIVTSVNIFLRLCWKTIIYPHWLSPLRYLPTAKGGNFVLGHVTLAFERPAGSPYLKFLTDVPNDGIIRVPGILNLEQIFLTSPAALAEVLVHKSYDYEKPPELRNFLRSILGDGLILVEGDEHKFQRKHVSPAFSFRHIKDLYPIFWSKATEVTQCIASEVARSSLPYDEKPMQSKSVVEINHWANKVTMDIIGVAGLGRNFNALWNSDDELIRNYEELTEPTTEKVVFFTVNLIFSKWLVSKLPWNMNQRLKMATTSLREICRQLVSEKKELIKTQQQDNVDILSLLIKSNSFADDMLVDQLLTFLAAGHETTSSSFTWCSYLLAKHPEAQLRLREEIRANLPSPSPPLDSDTDLAGILESLPYLSAVCNETLRLFPPVPQTLRIAIRPTTILSHQIPERTRIQLSPWAINRSPELWGQDAGEFRPERWIDSETGRANNMGGVSSNYSMLTFLHGPRSCIGEKFARSELRALVAVFCGTFSMSMADPNEIITPSGVVTAKPKNGMRLRLEKVEGW